MRLDTLLCRLRFVKSRGRAQRLVEEGRIRIDRVRVTRHACLVRPGQVLTFPVGSEVRVIEVTALPARRGPPAEARAHYRDLVAETANDSQEAPSR